MAGLTVVIAVAEAMLFAILGQVVDWLASSDPTTFVQESWMQLILMSLFCTVLYSPSHSNAVTSYASNINGQLSHGSALECPSIFA